MKAEFKRDCGRCFLLKAYEDYSFESFINIKLEDDKSVIRGNKNFTRSILYIIVL